MSIAVVVLTYNRERLLRRCVESVLGECSPATSEIVVWNNGSTDGTTSFLNSVAGDSWKVVNSPTNVGMVAYGRAFDLTTAPYIVQLDDDVVSAPKSWDATLLDAFERLPDIGYLAADVEDDPGDRLSHERHHQHEYSESVFNGVRILEGATGGWCTMTSRRIYDEVGGLPKSSRLTYFSTDTVYVRKLRRAGYRIAILPELRVHHSGDRVDAKPSSEKAAFFAREQRIERRKDAVKRALLLVPGLRAANRRWEWFQEPAA